MENTFYQEVDLKYQIYNSLFLRLPFEIVKKTGTYLPIFHEHCQQSIEKNLSPSDIISSFFEEHMQEYRDKQYTSMLFNFIQYIERQVVLFDAVETAAFDKVHNLNGEGTFSEIMQRAKTSDKLSELVHKLNDFNLRVVLTAHPTQFYPDSVLVIIDHLSEALKNNELSQVNQLLMQLAKTPFF